MTRTSQYRIEAWQSRKPAIIGEEILIAIIRPDWNRWRAPRGHRKQTLFIVHARPQAARAKQLGWDGQGIFVNCDTSLLKLEEGSSRAQL